MTAFSSHYCLALQQPSAWHTLQLLGPLQGELNEVAFDCLKVQPALLFPLLCEVQRHRGQEARSAAQKLALSACARWVPQPTSHS